MKNFNTTKLLIAGGLIVGGIAGLRVATQNKSQGGQAIGAIAFAGGLVMLLLAIK